ncbi:hypothetical protein Q31a_09160 [Aureliella helgolandensis]|uniref:Uncharacterized protein n=1 Tax=Aureliella helgolandensis TaxID=2527968 RepID=A0A518G242_9BACT|nr:hypothetical protein Q31a_09160 [Aureliella helgolandensis]
MNNYAIGDGLLVTDLKSLEFETRFSRCFGEGGYATMVATATAIESNGLDSGSGSTLGDEFTDFGSSFTVAAVAHASIRILGGCTGEGSARFVVDQLAVKVLERTINAQAWSTSIAANFVPHSEFTAFTLVVDDFLKLHDAPVSIAIELKCLGTIFK